MKLKNRSMLFVILALQLSFLPTSVGAQATRHAVILEIATGNWSQYGPGAALGADQLHASPASVGIVQHHQGDAFATPDANARCLNYYGVNNFPDRLS